MNTIQIIALVLLGVSVTAAYIYTETKYKGAHRRNNGTYTKGNRDFLKTTQIVRPDFATEENFKRAGENRQFEGCSEGSYDDTRKEKK